MTLLRNVTDNHDNYIHIIKIHWQITIIYISFLSFTYGNYGCLFTIEGITRQTLMSMKTYCGCYATSFSAMEQQDLCYGLCYGATRSRLEKNYFLGKHSCSWHL